MKASPVQIAIIVVALLVAIGSVTWMMMRGDGVTLRHSVTLIDVTTGEVFEVSTKKRGVVLPGTNPKTGRAALLPLYKDEDGSWRVPTRYLGDLGSVEGEVSAIDPRTGRVLVEVGR